MNVKKKNNLEMPEDEKPSPEENEQSFDLDEAMTKLESIVERLESEGIGIDKAFQIFEEGSRLSEKINKKINSYERKLTILNEQYQLEDFHEDSVINKSDEES